MSVINQMLQDLEKRRAGASEGAAMPDQVRPLPIASHSGTGRSPLLGFGVAAIIVLVAAIWWATKTSVAPPAPQSAPVAASPVATPAIIQPPPLPAPNRPRPVASAVPATLPAASAVAKTTTDKPAHTERKELRLSPSLQQSTPVVAQTAARAPAQPTAVAAQAAARISAPVIMATAEVPAKAEPAAPAEPAPKPRPDFAPGTIDKQPRPVSPRERADIDYRRATAALGQGHAEEAEEALRAALADDATYDAARQALVGMLVEQKRVDEAKKLLQEYLASRPNHLGFATLLARLQIDRGDSAGAIATMQRSQPYAGENADFMGFSAALMQRAGRHQDAADLYRSALRLKPDAAVWWMGLGISLQATERGADALDAYRRSLTSGSLSPELQAFVEQRIKQLTP